VTGQEFLECTTTVSQPSLVIPGPTERPARHWHSLLTCLLGIQILICARCCLRGSKVLLQILQQHLGIGTPSHETLRRWLLRIGLYVLRRPLEAAADWVWIVDHSAPVGPEKCLVVIAVRQSVVRAKNWALTHQDFRVLHLDVMSNSTGELMKQQLLQLVDRFGSPQQIVSDHGTDLKKGIHLLRQAFPTIIDTYDISHKLANLLKAELSNDKRWQAFLTHCAKARPQLQQTQGSHLMPPEVRVKARYMNLNRQVSWAQKTLKYLDAPDDPLLAKKLGLTDEQARLWVDERLGWLRDFREDLILYGAMMQVIEFAQTVVKQNGLRRDIVRRVSLALPTDLSDHHRLQRITSQINQFLVEESAKLPDDEGYLGSSDMIESLFGKHKLFTENNKYKGIGPNILLLPLLTVNWTSTLVRDALEATTCAEVTQWLKSVFGKPMPMRIRPIRTRAQRRASKKRHENSSHSTAPV
jgi:hypothetical protein